MKRVRLALAAALLAANQPQPMAAESLKTAETRSGLPFAGDKAFSSLDEYLALLEERSAMDIPYYRRLPDGRYERMTGRAQKGRKGEILTREQLLRKYGFAR